MKSAVSSGCFLTNDIDEMVAYSKGIGIEIIELGQNVKHSGGRKGLIEKLNMYADIEFLMHHYFAAPQTAFVCNIGHPCTVEVASEFIEDNIKVCSALGIPYYSVHAGYGVNPSPSQLGRKQSSLAPIAYDQSLKLFVDTAMKLERFSRKYGVNLLWENNVVCSGNLFGTKRTPYLFSDIEFLKEMENDIWWRNALVLLDIGHLKVSATSLKYSIEEFIERIGEKVVQVHVSENDGFEDTNQPVTEKSLHTFNRLKSFANIETAILEVYNIPLPAICEQISIIDGHWSN